MLSTSIVLSTFSLDAYEPFYLQNRILRHAMPQLNLLVSFRHRRRLGNHMVIAESSLIGFVLTPISLKMTHDTHDDLRMAIPASGCPRSGANHKLDGSALINCPTEFYLDDV